MAFGSAAARRQREREAFERFLVEAQSNTGGYYELPTGRPVEFLRPLKSPFVRIRDMRDGSKTNVHYETLTKLNEMSVLAYMTWTEEDEKKLQEQERIARGPETRTTNKDAFEPQEPGDVRFFD